jgi:cytochrome c556
MKKNTFLFVLGAVVLGAAYSLPAYSQAKPTTLVKQRQAVMTLHGKYFYPIRSMAQGKTPYDPSVITRNVGYLEPLSKMPWDGFAPSTKDVKSGATPAVFSDSAKFKEAEERYQAEVTKLAELTRRGDEASIRSQIMAVDKTCNSCHDTFRERD